MKKIFNKCQLSFMRSNFKSMTYKEMSKLDLFENLTSKQIRNKASSIGLKKKRQFNESYFEKIDNDEKAYYLGLLYADGWNTSNYEIGVSLKTEDRYMLENLSKSIGNVHKIKERKRNIDFNGYNYISKTSDLRIYSKKMSNDLFKNGIVYKKTNNIQHPQINDKYFFDFLRGFMDGDGCIYRSKNKNYLLLHFTNSNFSFLKYINDQVFLHLGIEGKIYKEKDKKYRLMFFRKEEVYILLSYLYKNENGLKLQRKFNLYCEYGSLAKETSE